jgi:hypothetical protein
MSYLKIASHEVRTNFSAVSRENLSDRNRNIAHQDSTTLRIRQGWATKYAYSDDRRFFHIAMGEVKQVISYQERHCTVQQKYAHKLKGESFHPGLIPVLHPVSVAGPSSTETET